MMWAELDGSMGKAAFVPGPWQSVCIQIPHQGLVRCCWFGYCMIRSLSQECLDHCHIMVIFVVNVLDWLIFKCTWTHVQKIWNIGIEILTKNRH